MIRKDSPHWICPLPPGQHLVAVHITLVNISPSLSHSLKTSFAGDQLLKSPDVQSLTSKNSLIITTFRNPGMVKSLRYSAAQRNGRELLNWNAYKSVVMLGKRTPSDPVTPFQVSPRSNLLLFSDASDRLATSMVVCYLNIAVWALGSAINLII